MNTSNKYCIKCGAQINKDANFCNSCGEKINSNENAPVESTPPPIPQIFNERVLAAIPVYLKEKIVLMKAYVIVFTEKRVIFVKYSNEVAKREAKRAVEEAKANGKGLLGRIAASAVSGFNLQKRLFDMTPEQILAESADNFQIGNSEVLRVKFKESRYSTDAENNTTRQPARLIFETAAKKYNLTINAYGEERELKNLLKTLFEGRLGKIFF